MVKLTIEGKKISVPEGTTIMEAAETAGIHIPRLCYLKDINEIGACRVCVVEVKGMNKLITACNNVVESDMEIYVNSPRARNTRKTNVEMILSDHDCMCATCARSGNCTLQTISNDLGILNNPYHKLVEKNRWDSTFPLIRNASKCIKCMRCIQICDKVQSMNIWNVSGSGFRTTVAVTENKKIKETDCTLCGQCITHCPVGALRERDDVGKALRALADPDKITIVQVAPAVRAAWGEGVGISKEEATLGKLVASLRRIGFDYIFDTTFTADLTIMEEGSEFIERFSKRDEHKWPMFTSCCPGWVRFVKTQHPDLIENLSTAKSPQQMFGVVTKTYLAKRLNIDPEKIFSISIMPCIAKKYEANVEENDKAGNGKDVDLVLTTREIERMIRADYINPRELNNEEFDEIFGVGSGAGVIFGATGGVMEAALRSAYFLITGRNPDPDSFKNMRGIQGWKEGDFEIEGVPIKVAVASGLRNARELVEAIKNNEVSYDFVEIMACPGGCAGGGGQPITDGQELAEQRAKTLYGLDRMSNLRFSHENESIKEIYEDFLEKPLSHKSHELLHTEISKWKMFY